MMNFSVLLLACGVALRANAGTTVTVDGGWFAPQGNGSFSAVAQNICRSVVTESADLPIRSPDGKSAVVVRNNKGEAQVFAVDKTGKNFPIPTAGWPCVEIGWSAGSDGFFLNYSNGGAVGTYDVAVYHLSKGKLAHRSLTQMVKKDFLGRYPKCFSPEDPNIVGIGWSMDGTRLLLAAEVLPHANCDNMGTFMLYEIAITSGKIIRRFSQLEAKTAFRGLLGSELQAADDECFIKPGTCFIPMLHGAGDTQTISN